MFIFKPYQEDGIRIFYVRVSGLDKIDYHSEKKVTVSKIRDGGMMQVDLIDGMTFDIIRFVKSIVKVGVPKIGKDNVSVQFLDDSYTPGTYFKYAFWNRDTKIDWNLLRHRL